MASIMRMLAESFNEEIKQMDGLRAVENQFRPRRALLRLRCPADYCRHLHARDTVDVLNPNDFGLKPDALPDKLKCPLCYLVFHDPVSVCSDGHTFCLNCVEKHMTTGRKLTCPTCKTPLSPFQRNLSLRTELEEFPAKCKFEKCDYKGPMHTMKTHLQSCAFETFPCPNKRCHKHGTKVWLVKHQETCDFEQLTCGCGAEYRRCREKDHKMECLLEEKLCIECEEKLTRAAFIKHQHFCPLASVTCYLCGTEYMKKNEANHFRSSLDQHVLQQTRSVCHLWQFTGGIARFPVFGEGITLQLERNGACVSITAEKNWVLPVRISLIGQACLKGYRYDFFFAGRKLELHPKFILWTELMSGAESERIFEVHFTLV